MFHSLNDWMDFSEADLSRIIDIDNYELESGCITNPTDITIKEDSIRTYQTIQKDDNLLKEYAEATAMDEANNFVWAFNTAKSLSHERLDEFIINMSAMGYSYERIREYGYTEPEELMKIDPEELFEIAKSSVGLGSYDITYTGKINARISLITRVKQSLKEGKMSK